MILRFGISISPRRLSYLVAKHTPNIIECTFKKYLKMQNCKLYLLQKIVFAQQQKSMESPLHDREMCVYVCVYTHMAECMSVSMFTFATLSLYIFSSIYLVFFPHSIPSFLLLQLSSLLLFPSLFCKLGALARRRISLFGKSWCGANVFFSYSFLYVFLLFLIKCYFGLFFQKHF